MMQQFLFLLIGTFVSKAIFTEAGKNCEISIDHSTGDLSEPQPLILTATKKPTFLLPFEDYRSLIIPSGKSILLACPGANNSLENFEPLQSIKAVCLKNKQFTVDSVKYSFNTFKCKNLPVETVKKSRSRCLDEHQKYEIGFKVGGHFLKLYEVCRNEDDYRTYYSKHTLVKEINSLQTRFKRPDWKYLSFYPEEVDQAYFFKAQVENLGTLLGSDELAHKYMYHKSQTWQMFHRGHLTPKADFVYGAQQATTFWLLNTNPQWGSFNTGNWMRLENCVRDFAFNRSVDLVVYTGVHGTTTLPDENNNDQELYLYGDDVEYLLPVPRFFWKILHDPISNQATAFVGVNEPYAKTITEDMYLCPDISNDYEFTWLHWLPNNITAGVSYICTVEDLQESVPTIPKIGHAGLLI